MIRKADFHAKRSNLQIWASNRTCGVAGDAQTGQMAAVRDEALFRCDCINFRFREIYMKQDCGLGVLRRMVFTVRKRMSFDKYLALKKTKKMTS